MERMRGMGGKRNGENRNRREKKGEKERNVK